MSNATITAPPVLTLRNGIRVANFSSPHPFHFVTGEVLPACDEERCRHLSAVAKEVETERDGWIDIQLAFELGNECVEEIVRLEADDSIDVILAPLPIVQAARAAGIGTKLRTVRMADRVQKLAHVDRFCV